MALSVISSFAKFLKDQGYSTTMWENGYSADETNTVCHKLTDWAQRELGLNGEFLVLWSSQDGTTFSGDNELVYFDGDQAFLVPNPFLEGETEGFITTMNKVLFGKSDELYVAPLSSRILYNAV